MNRKSQTCGKRWYSHHNIQARIISVLAVVSLFFLLPVNRSVAATWPVPGDWPVWGSQPGDINPVAWPGSGSWHTYTSLGSALADPSIADPSNGGTSPQNYVSVTSNCPDKTLPSVYWAFDGVNEMLFFRFRLAAIPNTYATGPSAGAAAVTDPWRSAQWSVLIDIDGDGYREFAVQLDGSTGSPSTQVDRMSIIYSNTPSNSLDYTVVGSGIYLVNQFPTAYVQSAGGIILNFHNSNSPDTSWPNGSSETVWDYGMTRSTNGSTAGCTEYITDYQIPLSMLDATSVGGPKLTKSSSMSFLYATANSLQNPFQKDVVTTGDTVYIGDPTEEGPFGDIITPEGGGSLPQATVASATASGCGPVSLSAVVNDAIKIVGGVAVTSVTAVDFYYYADTNADGIENDSGTWTLIGGGTTTNNPIGLWTASWNSSALSQGRYLIGVKAFNGQGNITWSWMNPVDIGSIGSTPPNYANPTAAGQVFAIFTNSCGAPPPYAVKTSNASAPVTPGAAVIFTVTVYNTSVSPITVSQITDSLPSGFTYQSTGTGTLGVPSSSPTAGDSGTLTWTFPPANVPAGANRTLIFTCNASTTAGSYSNSATVETSVGDMETEPTSVSVGSPQLTVTKSASAASVAPGGTLVYTIGYANTSPVNVTGVIISEPLPDGLTYVSNTGGGIYTAGTRTVDWTIGNLAAGSSGSVTVTVTVDDPFPSTATIPVVNTAGLSSTESGTTTASASVYVSAPRPVLSVQKSTSPSTVAENTSVTFTISYANTGNATATSLVLTDPVPSGLTFVSAAGGGTYSGGTVTWNLPDLAANASGSVTVTLLVPIGYSGANPITNTVTLSASGITPVTNSYWLGVRQTANICNTYYFTNTTGSVGADGVRYLADTTVPTGSGTNLLFTLPSYPSTPVPFTEITRFYGPAETTAIDFSGNLTTTYWVDRVNGNAVNVRVTVYDYDSTSGTKTQLGTNTVSLGGSSKGMQTFTVALSGTLQKNHRLLWIIEGAEQLKNKTDDIYFQFGGTVANPISGGTVNATSNGAVCFTPPANLVIDKQVDLLTAGPGNTLTYTILFSNTGMTNATGAQVTDTLPPGVTYVSATLNGGAVSPASGSGQVYTFNVNSSDTGTVGQVTGGQSGTLVITATVNSPLASGITSLTNSASLVSAQTAAETDTTVTAVLRPDVTVSQSADRTLVGPGDTVTYTFIIINSGTGSATNVTLADVLPVTAYYTYVPGSTTLNGAPAADNVSGGALNFNIGALASGGTAIVTLQMVGGTAASFPAAQTNLANTATVSDSQTSGSRSSNTVTVTINPLPNLSISKSFSPSGPYAAGDVITCDITVSNEGGSDALGVIVTDNIPTYTTYVSGSLVYEGASKTDAAGDDAGSFDASGNRAVFRVGTLPSGSSRAMSLDIRVQKPMPSGSTTLSNTAGVSSSNASSKSTTITGTVEAEATLGVTKVGPATSPYPSAAVTAGSTGVTVQVDDISPFSVNQYIRAAGQNRRIVSISGDTLTVESAITVSNGDLVIGSITYSLQYSNSGSADAVGALLVDTLPTGAIYVTSTGSGVYTAGPETVTWSIGSIPVSSLGMVQVTIFPGSAGIATNSATLTATGSDPASDSVSTGVGGLRITKRTTTPSIIAGGTANYILEVENTSPSTASGVVVTDTLPSGFTYSSTDSISGGTRTSTSDPTVGDQVPSWGTFDINSGNTLTIIFNASVAAGIAGTFDNELSVTSSDTPVGTFDPLLTTEEDVTVSIPTPAPTGSLSNGTGDISEGCSATLDWTAANATSGTLDPGSISVPVGDGSGSIIVTPAVTTVYTLSLSGPGGSTSYTATVTVNAAPAITAFSASPATITAGDSITFSATFTGGTGVITPGGYPINSGGAYVLATGPIGTTVYTLTVTAPCGSASQDTETFTVTVNDVPPNPVYPDTNTTVGTSTTVTPTNTGGTITSATLKTGSIPPGMTLNADGTISGTPTTAGVYTGTIEDCNSGGCATASFKITVCDQQPTNLSYSTSPLVLTKNQAMTANDATVTPIQTGTVTFSVSPALPTGLSLNTTTGEITGTPTTITAAADYTITVTNECGLSTDTILSITVNDLPPNPIYTDATTTVGTPLSVIPTNSGGPITSASVTGGSLPPGMSLNSDGSITGTPTTVGVYTVTVNDCNTGGCASRTVTITVNDPDSEPIVAVYPDGVGEELSPLTVTPTITSGGPAVSAVLATGSIPSGMTLNADGTITGTPALGSAGTYHATITLTNASGGSITVPVTITISAAGSTPIVADYPISTVDVGTYLEVTPNITSGGPAVSATLADGNIPPGMTLNADGTITGTPTTAGTYTAQITLTNASGGQTTVPAVIVVVPLGATPIVASYTPAVSPVNTPLTVTPSVTSGGPVANASLATGSLPPGMTLNSDGTITGTPTVEGVYTMSITLCNGSGGCITVPETITITPVDAPTGSLSSAGDISLGCTATLNWTAANAASGTINPGGIAVPVGDGSGSINVSPAVTTVYTLSLSGPGGSASYNATVTVNAAPAITAFSAAPATIAAGDSVTFSATFSGGTGVITPGGYAIVSGGTYVLATGPSGTTVYTLTVTAPCGSASQDSETFTVTVNDVPPNPVYPDTNTTVGTSTTVTPTNTGGAITSATLNTGSIPPGMTLNADGAISGTPTTAGVYTGTIEDCNSGGCATASFKITVCDQQPTNLSYSTSPLVLTKNQAMTADDPTVTPIQTGTVSFSVSPALPTGLSLDTLTGQISGTPTAITAAANYTITVTNECGLSTDTILSITVNDLPPNPIYTDATTTVGTPLSVIPTNLGGPITSASVTGGSLPPGMSLNSDGSITGTPTTVGVYTVTVNDCNTGGCAVRTVTITVNDPASEPIAAVYPDGVGVELTPLTVTPTITSGGPAVSATLATGSIPAGMTLNADGTITGTPALGTAGTYHATITLTNTSGGSITVPVTITISAAGSTPIVADYPISTVDVGTYLEVTPNITSGGPAVSATLAGGNIPPGMTLNADGTITGTPTTAGTYTSQITLTNASGGQTTVPAVIVVVPLGATPIVASYTPAVSPVNTPLTVTPSVTSGGPVVSASLATGSIPPGMTLNSDGSISGTPTVDGVYTMSITLCNGSGGCITIPETITITPVDAPTGSLSSAGDISVGCTATLNWTAVNATSGTLNPGGIAVPVGDGSGSVNVTPTITTVYTLSLSGPGGSVSYNATVTVDPAPAITDFSATPSTIAAGDSVTFSATFSGGTGVITPGNYPINSGDTYVLGVGPVVTTVYTLTVTAPCGSASQDTANTTVTVADVPSGSLSSAGDISVGCTATLNWTAANATSGTINPGGISIPVGDGSGSVNVTPTITTVYTLSLSGPGGSVSYNATVTVDPAPAITDFSATPSTIAAGDSVTFSATFSGGTGVITPGGYAITSGGTYVLATGPSGTTAYTLTVTAPCGSDSQATATTTVTVANAPSGSLNSAGDISEGCTATLNWTAANATSGTINPGSIVVPVGDGSGSVTVTPTVTTVYTMSLTGPSGSASYNVTVTVNPAPNITAFSASPSTIAAGDSVTFSATFSGGTGVITPGGYAITSGGTYVLATGPSGTTTYTLTVTAACGSASQATATTTVTVANAPSGSLSSAGDISVGCTATLNWTAANAASGTINPGGISVPVGDGSGSVTVTPTTTTVYTLSLNGPGGSASYNVTVTVNPAPVITAFSASPSTIAAGDSVAFSATFTGGTGVITPGGYAITSGGAYVLATGPSSTTTYTLTVTAACGSASQATATTTVTVGPAPGGSLNFSGDISLGCTATLNWTATNATSGTLNPGGISVPVVSGSGSITVTPIVTTVYTLSLTGPGGSASFNATVTVNPAPAITAFSAAPSTIAAGDSVTFSATFTGGTGVITPGGYAITSGGTYVLATGPSSTTTYTLTVTAACGSASQATATTTVTVSAAPGGSLSSAGDISVGCTATLNWTATNATSGTINPGGISVPAASGSGSVTVTPTTTTVYTLSLSGPGGSTSYNATVTVNPAPDITAFSASPSNITAGDPVIFSATFTGGAGVITPGGYAITSGGTYALAAGPSVTTVYTLTVTAACGSASQDTAFTTVTVAEPPDGSLDSSGDISVGCAATLNWTANNADTGILDPGNIPVPVENGLGSITVNPTVTTTYTLTLTGPGGTVTYNAIVIVDPAPFISAFSASPSMIYPGESVTFSAAFTGGTGIITPGNYPITSGGTYVLPKGPNFGKIYTLTVTAPCGSDSQAIARVKVKVINNRLNAFKSAVDINGGNLMPGDEVLYTISIVSLNDNDLPGVEFSDAIPANTAYVEGSATGPNGSSVIFTNNTLYFSNITVPARGQVLLMFKVRINNPVAPGVKEIINQGIVGYDQNGDGQNDSQALTDGDTVITGEQETVLSLVQGANFGDTIKTYTLVEDQNQDGIPSPGDTVRYEINIKNSGDVDAFGVVFRDTVPEDTDYVPNSVAAASGTPGYDAGANQVQWTGDLIMGGTVTITFDVVIRTGIPLRTTISNQGVIEYDFNNDGVNDTELLTDGNVSLPGRQPTEFTVDGISSIPATKIAIPVDTVLPTPGDEIRYEIVISNPTGYLLMGLELVDSIPANTTLAPGSIVAPAGAVVVSETPTLRITDISIGAFSQVKITFNVRIDSFLPSGIDRIVNQGTVNFDTDGDGFNDKSTLTDWDTTIPGEQPTVTVITCPVLEIRDTSLEATVKCGEEIEYLVEYTNISIAPAKNVVIKSIYDNKTAFQSSYPEPDPGSTNTWTIGRLEPGQSGSILIKVKVMDRLPYLYVAQHSVTLTSNCDIRQAGARTNVVGCGPR